MNFLWIAIGGAVGSLLRYMVYESSAKMLGVAFPYATLIVNVVGSFIMGMLSVWLVNRLSLSYELRMLLVVGFLGAFTTFSAFSLDTIMLFRETPVLAGLNILLNVVLSLSAVYLGILAVK